MLKVEQIIKNLIGIKVTDAFENDIICAFDSTEEVIVSRHTNGTYLVSEKREDAPTIIITVKNETITEAREY